jgi:RsiW-degrading membrane proteinase PrsW (M82 family)
MEFTVKCNCGTQLKAREEHIGKQTKCPGCGKILTVPDPSDDGNPYDLAEDAPLATPNLLERPASPDDQARVTPTTTWAPAPRARSRQAPDRFDPESGSDGSLREYLYWLLVFALVPLTFSLLVRDEESVRDRLIKRLKSAPQEVLQRVGPMLESKSASLDDVLNALPEGRLDEHAHLPRNSLRHWIYAALAAAGFLTLIACFFSQERVPSFHLLLIGLFTGTLGILFLIVVQWLANVSLGLQIRGRGVVVVLVLLAKFIGFSYRAALDPSNGFLLSFLGFTCGVGLCEELCKALPLIGYYQRHSAMGWRGACLWGLASGIGFGVSEGIMYAGDKYNGIGGVDIYIVRFISCVALHAMWSASVGITLNARQETLQGEMEWHEYGLAMLRILAVPMVLHGFYDTLLKKDMNALALVVAVISFAWLAWKIESARHSAREVAFA